MKIILLAVALFATSAYGQDTDHKSSIDTLPAKPALHSADTNLLIIHAAKESLMPQPAFFINGRLMTNQSSISSINPNDIEHIEVLKRDTLIQHVLYNGQVYIQTKKEHTPVFITLTELISKYTDLKGKPVVFVIDGNFVNADYNNYLVDERNLLSVFIDTMKMGDQQLNIGLVKVLTKTAANIQDRNRIMIRGGDLSLK